MGFINDPQLDYGTEGRSCLRDSWNNIFRKARVHDIVTSMHLHNTSEGLFWETEHLQILEPHVDDPMYNQEITKQKLKETDKQLKASILVTLFDKLIQTKLESECSIEKVEEKIGETWTQIRRNDIDPIIFVEETALIEKRLHTLLERFGETYISYAGPECGFGSWPSYELALEGLQRISTVVSKHNS